MRKVFINAFLLAALAGIIGTTAIDLATAQDKKEKSKAADAKSEKDKDSKAITVIEVYKDSAGEFRFRIKHDDTVLAMASKGYEKKADCEKVIDIIKRDAAKAKVVETK